MSRRDVGSAREPNVVAMLELIPRDWSDAQRLAFGQAFADLLIETQHAPTKFDRAVDLARQGRLRDAIGWAFTPHTDQAVRRALSPMMGQLAEATRRLVDQIGPPAPVDDTGGPLRAWDVNTIGWSATPAKGPARRRAARTFEDFLTELVDEAAGDPKVVQWATVNALDNFSLVLPEWLKTAVVRRSNEGEEEFAADFFEQFFHHPALQPEFARRVYGAAREAKCAPAAPAATEPGRYETVVRVEARSEQGAVAEARARNREWGVAYRARQARAAAAVHDFTPGDRVELLDPLGRRGTVTKVGSMTDYVSILLDPTPLERSLKDKLVAVKHLRREAPVSVAPAPAFPGGDYEECDRAARELFGERGPSPKQSAAAGWTRTDPRPWTKLRARWQHVSGWRLEHCGHPTALRPWALYDPTGDMVLTGAVHGPGLGTAWPNLATAMAYVAIAGAKAPTKAPTKALNRSTTPVTCERCGETWPREPALEVACPSCHKRAGAWCVRPSHHRAMALHAAREKLAMEQGFLRRCTGHGAASAGAPSRDEVEDLAAAALKVSPRPSPTQRPRSTSRSTDDAYLIAVIAREVGKVKELSYDHIRANRDVWNAVQNGARPATHDRYVARVVAALDAAVKRGVLRVVRDLSPFPLLRGEGGLRVYGLPPPAIDDRFLAQLGQAIQLTEYQVEHINREEVLLCADAIRAALKKKPRITARHNFGSFSGVSIELALGTLVKLGEIRMAATPAEIAKGRWSYEAVKPTIERDEIEDLGVALRDEAEDLSAALRDDKDLIFKTPPIEIPDDPPVDQLIYEASIKFGESEADATVKVNGLLEELVRRGFQPDRAAAIGLYTAGIREAQLSTWLHHDRDGSLARKLGLVPGSAPELAGARRAAAYPHLFPLGSAYPREQEGLIVDAAERWLGTKGLTFATAAARSDARSVLDMALGVAEREVDAAGWTRAEALGT
jgi:hypothetical protein